VRRNPGRHNWWCPAQKYPCLTGKAGIYGGNSKFKI
jgi:hypothetical protein